MQTANLAPRFLADQRAGPPYPAAECAAPVISGAKLRWWQAFFCSVLLAAVPLTARATMTVDTSSGSVAMIAEGPAATIDDGITIMTDEESITGAQAMVANNFAAGADTLSWDDSLASSHGISGAFNSSTGVLAFSGTTSPENWQAIFRTVTISTTSSSSLTRTVSFTVGNAIPLDIEGTSHFYEFVVEPGIDWVSAASAASTRRLFGLQGYLVTVTSAEENDFVASKLEGEGWMGASDADAESTWKWVTGPEAGTHFFTQTAAAGNSANQGVVYGSTSGGGIAVDGRYSGWILSEPNDWGTSGEDYAHFLSGGQWNDYRVDTWIEGYVVEYGGMDGDPELILTASREVNAQRQYTVSPSVSAGGSVTPDTPQSVDSSIPTSFTLTADAGYTHSNTVGGDCPAGHWNSNTYTTGNIAGNCSVSFTFTDAPQPAADPGYADGTTTCHIAGCAVTALTTHTKVVMVDELDADGTGEEDTQRTVEILVITDPGDSGSGVVHELTVRDRHGNLLHTTRGESASPGSRVVVDEDTQGRPQVTTRLTLKDGTVSETTAQADGSTTHRVTPPGGTATEAITVIPGALSKIRPDGRVVTMTDGSSCNTNIRAAVETSSTGEGVTRLETYDELRATWSVSSRTLDDTVSRFESGHRIRINGNACAPVFRIRTRVTRDIYF